MKLTLKTVVQRFDEFDIGEVVDVLNDIMEQCDDVQTALRATYDELYRLQQDALDTYLNDLDVRAEWSRREEFWLS